MFLMQIKRSVWGNCCKECWGNQRSLNWTPQASGI